MSDCIVRYMTEDCIDYKVNIYCEFYEDHEIYNIYVKVPVERIKVRVSSVKQQMRFGHRVNHHL